MSKIFDRLECTSILVLKVGGITMQIHKQKRSQRNQMGLSQEELAEEIFLSRQSISNWESGSNYPDLDSLVGTVRLNVMVLT